MLSSRDHFVRLFDPAAAMHTEPAQAAQCKVLCSVSAPLAKRHVMIEQVQWIDVIGMMVCGFETALQAQHVHCGLPIMPKMAGTYTQCCSQVRMLHAHVT
jgi:hypothetical protein